MSEAEEEPTTASAEAPQEESAVPLNRAQRRALAAGKSAPGNAALGGGNMNNGINRGSVPPAQRIQTRGAGRGK
jgi:hypothetical protein